MIVVILGHLVLDEIHPHTGGVIESLGGIFFPVGAFGSLARAGDTIRPAFPVGYDAWDQYMDAVRAFPRVDTGSCRRLDRLNTRVRLFHDEKAQYNTQLVSSLDPIDIADSRHVFTGADLVYINMMTGHDILIDDAERIRSMTAGLIYLDLHMIAYRVAGDGHRSTARVVDWQRWVNVPNVIQCNERELTTLGEPDTREEQRIPLLFSESGLDVIIVTRGERGSTVYRRSGPAIDVPAVPAASFVDSTGCGDVFGSTFSYYLASGSPAEIAGERAARASAFVASIPGSIGMAGLRAHMDSGTA